MAVAEDRRRITVRLVTLRFGAVVLFAALAIAFWFLQIVQNKKFEEMAREQPPADARPARAARVLFDSQRQVLVETGMLPDFDRFASTPRTLTDDPLLSQVAARDPADVTATVTRHRGEPSTADRVGRGCLARAGGGHHQRAGSTSSCRTSSSKKSHAAVSDRRAGGAPCSCTSGRQATQLGDGIQQGAIIGQSVWKTRLQQTAHGTGRRQACGRQQHGRRDPTLDQEEPVEGRRVQ